MLEPYEGKLSRTVLRGVGSRKAPLLPGEEKMKKRKKTMTTVLLLSLLMTLTFSVDVLQAEQVAKHN